MAPVGVSRTAEGRTPDSPPPGPTAPAIVAGSLAEADPESSPTVRKVRELLAAGEYAPAVRAAFDEAFEGTVRAYGLEVPVSCTDRQFVSAFLRPDMGKLTELLPDLYRLYEPVRFGKVEQGDRVAFEGLVRKLYSETVLARIHDPLFQPSHLDPSGERTSKYDALFRARAKGEKIG